MNIVFLCYAVDPTAINEYSGASVAGNKMQTSILKYLLEHPDVDLKTISVRPVAPFPKDKALLYRKGKESIYGANISEVRFINVPILKQYSQSHEVYKALRHKLKGLSPENTIILTYNLYPQLGVPAIKTMKRYGYKVVSLIADLPIDYATNRGILGNYIYNQYNIKTEQLIKQLLYAVVLNKFAAQIYAPNANYIVVDGGVDLLENSDVNPPQKLTYTDKNLLYCGSLHHYSGALTLAKAMKYIDDETIFLDIYGCGEDEDRIKALAKQDIRIRYHGVVDNDTVIQKQKEAYVLVNPRPINDPISKVTFPSKIFEYMISGTPVLSTRLFGFTDDYFGKLIFTEDDTVQGIANGIKSIIGMSDDQLLRYVQESYRFIVTQRSWKKQTERIITYLEECLYGHKS